MSALTYLFVLLVVLFTASSYGLAETSDDTGRPTHIIIAVDTSGSMDDLPERYIDMVRDGLIDALHTYTEDCGTTRISYVAWGDMYPVVVKASLNSPTARFRLIEQIVTLTSQMQDLTVHTTGYAAARKLVEDDENTILVFITDAPGTTNINEIPAFTVHKVALGDQGVADWLQERFLPHHGLVHQPHHSADLASLLSEILTSTKHEVCLG